jgi:hypothetical protein
VPLVPPLVQPKSPEFPLGVLTVTLAVPGAEIRAAVIVTCNCVLLVTTVLSFVPLITTTEDETNRAPYTSRTKPGCTSESVIVLAERDPTIGSGRALPHKGLSALQAWQASEASRSALRGRRKALILLWDRSGVGFLAFMVADYAAIRIEKNGQFRTENSHNWRKIAITLIDRGRPAF